MLIHWERHAIKIKTKLNAGKLKKIYIMNTYHVFSDFGTAQKMKPSVKDFFSRCDQIRSFLRIWSHLLKKSLVGNFIFCAV